MLYIRTHMYSEVCVSSLIFIYIRLARALFCIPMLARLLPPPYKSDAIVRALSCCIRTREQFHKAPRCFPLSARVRTRREPSPEPHEFNQRNFPTTPLPLSRSLARSRSCLYLSSYIPASSCRETKLTGYSHKP